MREAVSYLYHEKENCLSLIPHKCYCRNRTHFKFTGKKTLDFTDRSYTWHVDYKEKSDDIFIVRGKKIGEIKSDAKKLVAALNAADADPGPFRTPAEKEPGDPKSKVDEG